jgi:hypothetical protein
MKRILSPFAIVLLFAVTALPMAACAPREEPEPDVMEEAEDAVEEMGEAVEEMGEEMEEGMEVMGEEMEEMGEEMMDEEPPADEVPPDA